MKFLEYKAKEIFARYGIPVPQGVVASNAEDISDPPIPCMVKAQVLVGGRGKAGGIKAAESLDEARAVSRQILGMDIHGYRVKQVYLEERLDISKELYVGLTIDRSAREPLLMASATGGMEIEAVPRDQIFMEHVPTMAGLQPYVLRTMASFLRLPTDTGGRVADIVRRSYDLFRKEDAELVEINPLAVTRDGRVIAGDAKLVIDGDARRLEPQRGPGRDVPRPRRDGRPGEGEAGLRDPDQGESVRDLAEHLRRNHEGRHGRARGAAGPRRHAHAHPRRRPDQRRQRRPRERDPSVDRDVRHGDHGGSRRARGQGEVGGRVRRPSSSPRRAASSSNASRAT